MTIYLLDPALRSYRGHHMTGMTMARTALVERGQAVRVVAHRGAEPEVLRATGAEPLFSVSSYDSLSDDPLCGPLETLLAGSRIVAADLQALAPADGDVMVWLTATPVQLLAAALCLPRWPARLLSVFVGGLAIGGLDPVLWRYAWRRLPPRALRTVSTTAEPLGREFSRLLQCPVHVAPNTHECPVRDRRGASPVTIGVLGFQRQEKGTVALPEVVRRTRSPVRWIIQNSGLAMPPVMDALAAMPNVEVIRGVVEDWTALLQRCDALLMPYDRAWYRTLHSGVVAEAMSGAIPMVIPDAEALMVQSEGGGRVAYSGDGPEAIAAAVDTLTGNFDALAGAALEGAARYAAVNGPGRWADWLLAHAGEALGRPRSAGEARP